MTVEVFIDSEGTLTGWFFQDSAIKSVFSSYPDVLLIDTTYKLTNLRMPVYLLMSNDGNGQGDIFMVFLTALGTEEAITKMMKAFRTANPA